MTTSGDFTVSPACPVTYSMSVTPATTIVSFDSSTKTFSISEATDLAQASTTSPFETDYTVTLTGSSGDVTSKTAMKTFGLKVKNPCVDIALNSIVSPADFSRDYSIYANKLEIDYSSFSVQLQSICGSDITYTITGLTSYIKDDSTNSKLIVYSTDLNLNG